MQDGDPEWARPGQVIPQSFEPCHMARHSRSASTMHGAHIAWVRCGSPCIGGSGTFLDLAARMPGGTILDILRGNEALNGWFVVMIILPGVGALSLHGYDVQRVLIRIAFGRFVLGGALWLGYRRERL
jgi:hypothetical protein